MSITSEIRLRIRKEGDVVLNQLSAKLNDLAQRSVISNNKFKNLADTLKRSDDQIRTKSIAGLQDYARAWRELANNVDITSKEFKEATREAEKFERQAARAQGRRGGALAGLAKGVGTVAAAGVFGGLEGAAGAGLGFALGGPAGAVVGAGIGAQIGNLRQQAAAIAENIASINKYRIALAGVSKDQSDYNTSIKDVTTLSKAYLLPISDATEQYTKLKASIVGAGLTTKETTEVFKGIAAAVVGTGGSAEDLNSALRATAQVFSKGKVSAEELRQQIGERLPGAFTIFAQSLGISTQELDKRLEDGKVTLADFLTFSTELFNRYGKTAEILADSPEKAGARLKVALDFATLAFGGFFQKVGAGFQDYARGLVEFALNNEQTIKRVITVLAIGFNQIAKLVGGFARFVVGVFNTVFSTILGNLETVLARVEDAINRAKAVQSLTPEKVARIRGQARKETAAEYGLFGTEIMIDQNAAGKFYDKRFNELIDAATKSAGATKYTSKIQNLIFPDFKITQGFGAGAGTGADVLGGDSATGGKEGKKKGIQDISNALAAAQKAALQEINPIQKSVLDFEAKLLAISESQEPINKRSVKLAEALASFKKEQEELGKKIAAGNVDEFLRAEERNRKTKEQIENLEIEAGIISEKDAQEIRRQQFINQLKKEDNVLTQEQVDRINKAFDRINQKSTESAQLLKSIGQTLQTGIADAFMSIVDSAKSLRDVLSDVLRQTARLLFEFGIRAGLKALAPSLFAMGGVMTSKGSMPLRSYARGGIATSPQMALFGEGSTPEAYVPLPDGRSIPVTLKNGKDGGGINVNVNVDAAGSEVAGNNDQAGQLGKVIGLAVQQELIKQKRPGGLLSGV